MALGHDRDGDRLTVRGVVRNPASGMALDRITAVVLVYKEDGGFVGSGRAAVDSTMLGPGGETAFTVTVPAASRIGRYRVSFAALKIASSRTWIVVIEVGIENVRANPSVQPSARMSV